MIYMLCRNRVTNFEKWKSIFDSHSEAHKGAGLSLMNIWRSHEEPDNVFFLFEVNDIEKARAFIHSPESSEVGIASGVIEGEMHFLDKCSAS